MAPGPAPAPAPLGPSLDTDTHTLTNDYNQHYIDSGLTSLPGAWVHHGPDATHCTDYPSLHRLRSVKDDLVDACASPATYLKTDLRASLPGRARADCISISDLVPIKYDVVIIDPPLHAYAWDAPCATGDRWTWDDVAALPIPRLAAKESFVFLWVGPGTEGLEKGRQVLAHWGYRRCEDICWVRTNEGDVRAPPSPLVPSVQHCLMGIRGTVVRSTDTFFVHCNVDTDVIIAPGECIPGTRVVSPERKPHELYCIAERFCLGTRRIELFGTNRNIRRGWLTVGAHVGPGEPEWAANAVPYVSDTYIPHFGIDPPGCALALRSNLLPYIDEIEDLRPKTPPAVRRAKARSIQEQHAPWQYTPWPHPAPWPYTPWPHPAPWPYTPLPHPAPWQYTPWAYPSVHPVRAMLHGKGAGGATPVSVRSESDTLSGAQATVIEKVQKRQP